MTEPAGTFTERDSVRNICGRLHQAYRGFRLYPSDHPTAQRTLCDFLEVLAPHLDEYGSITLRVTEDQMLFEDEPVYSHADARGSLAFLMFRDGIRFVSFSRGLERAETEAFVYCLAHTDDLAAVEHDLTTALWERDLQHIAYEVVDPFLGGGGERLRDSALNDLRDTVLRRLSELNPGVGGVGGLGAWGSSGGSSEPATPGTTGGSAASEGGDADGRDVEGVEVAEGEHVGEEGADESYTPTPADLERTEWAVDTLKDSLGDFALVLLELAGTPGPDAKADAALARSLGLVAERYFEEDNIGGLERMVERIASLVSAGRRPLEFGAQVFGDAATTERLVRVIELMSQGSTEQAARIEAMLGQMRDWVLPAFLEMLAESSDKSVRRVALDLLDAQGGVPLAFLWPLMEDPRWYVVRNAVALATSSGDPSLADHLEPLLRHPDARVRREVIRSLDAAPGPRAATLVARALSDSDSSVRVLAANAVGRRGIRGNLPAVESHIAARDFSTRPGEEIAAFLEAFALLGREAAVEVLSKLWRRRLFGTKPLPLRLGAIQALGLVGTPSASEALNQAAKMNEVQIQRAAARALAESRSRARGGAS